MTRPAPDTTVRRTLRRAATAGVVLGAVVVLALLLAGDSDSLLVVVVWGGSLLVGVVATVAGLVFAGLARAVGWNEARAVSREYAQQQFMPGAVGLERSFLYIGVPLLITGVMLSVSLVLQGESLY